MAVSCIRCGKPASAFTTFCCPACGCDARLFGLRHARDSRRARTRIIWTLLVAGLAAAITGLMGILNWHVTYAYATLSNMNGPVQFVGATGRGEGILADESISELRLQIGLSTGGVAAEVDVDSGRVDARPAGTLQTVRLKQRWGRPALDEMVALSNVDPATPSIAVALDEAWARLAWIWKAGSKDEVAGRRWKHFNSASWSGFNRSRRSIAEKWYTRGLLITAGVWIVGLVVLQRARQRGAEPSAELSPFLPGDTTPTPPGERPRCARCGYSWVGRDGSICPECGGDFRQVGMTAQNAKYDRSLQARRGAWFVCVAIGGFAVTAGLWNEVSYRTWTASYQMTSLDERHSMKLTSTWRGHGTWVGERTMMLEFALTPRGSMNLLPATMPGPARLEWSRGVCTVPGFGTTPIYSGPLNTKAVMLAMGLAQIDLTDPANAARASELATVLPTIKGGVSETPIILGYGGQGISYSGRGSGMFDLGHMTLLGLWIGAWWLGDRFIVRRARV